MISIALLLALYFVFILCITNIREHSRVIDIFLFMDLKSSVNREESSTGTCCFMLINNLCKR